jgi:hypothetical protein
MKPRIVPTLAAAILAALPAAAGNQNGYTLSVVVDGSDRPEYAARGTTYVEALKGREYSLRVTNPFPYRVAVALSVDGLNTIDAKHTDAWSARKWVIEPFGSIVLDGWQVNDSTARHFVFTGERQSYGAFLGKTQNLGAIEAVFFREKPLPPPPPPIGVYGYGREKEESRRDAAAPSGAAPAEPQRSADGMSRSEGKKAAEMAKPSSQPALSDEYAATGMGDRTRHDVYRVDLELVRSPAATLRIRYEFRDQLVRLGVFPRYRDRDPLDRREASRGFSTYCPEPGL